MLSTKVGLVGKWTGNKQTDLARYEALRKIDSGHPLNLKPILKRYTVAADVTNENLQYTLRENIALISVRKMARKRCCPYQSHHQPSLVSCVRLFHDLEDKNHKECSMLTKYNVIINQSRKSIYTTRQVIYELYHRAARPAVQTSNKRSVNSPLF